MSGYANHERGWALSHRRFLAFYYFILKNILISVYTSKFRFVHVTLGGRFQILNVFTDFERVFTRYA